MTSIEVGELYRAEEDLKVRKGQFSNIIAFHEILKGLMTIKKGSTFLLLNSFYYNAEEVVVVLVDSQVSHFYLDSPKKTQKKSIFSINNSIKDIRKIS